jgi:uncharacterized iron-regulated membrane protein
VNPNRSRKNYSDVPSNVSPFASKKTAGFQFSMSSLLILMIVSSVMSASLLWASRLPMVTNEVHLWLGTTPAANQDGTDRGTQLIFLLFCYSAPLLLAALIHSSLLLIRATQSQIQTDDTFDEEL